eukprot:gene13251-15658_t
MEDQGASNGQVKEKKTCSVPETSGRSPTKVEETHITTSSVSAPTEQSPDGGEATCHEKGPEQKNQNTSALGGNKDVNVEDAAKSKDKDAKPTSKSAVPAEPTEPKTQKATALAPPPTPTPQDLERIEKEKAAAKREEEDEIISRAAEIRSRNSALGAGSLPPCVDPPRTRSHWDYVLVEMRWMATDFDGERRWKGCAARQVAKLAAAAALKPGQLRKVPAPNDSPNLKLVDEVPMETETEKPADGTTSDNKCNKAPGEEASRVTGSETEKKTEGASEAPASDPSTQAPGHGKPEESSSPMDERPEGAAEAAQPRKEDPSGAQYDPGKADPPKPEHKLQDQTVEESESPALPETDVTEKPDDPGVEKAVRSAEADVDKLEEMETAERPPEPVEKGSECKTDFEGSKAVLQQEQEGAVLVEGVKVDVAGPSTPPILDHDGLNMYYFCEEGSTASLFRKMEEREAERIRLAEQRHREWHEEKDRLKKDTAEKAAVATASAAAAAERARAEAGKRPTVLHIKHQDHIGTRSTRLDTAAGDAGEHRAGGYSAPAAGVEGAGVSGDGILRGKRKKPMKGPGNKVPGSVPSSVQRTFNGVLRDSDPETEEPGPSDGQARAPERERSQAPVTGKRSTLGGPGGQPAKRMRTSVAAASAARAAAGGVHPSQRHLHSHGATQPVEPGAQPAVAAPPGVPGTKSLKKKRMKIGPEASTVQLQGKHKEASARLQMWLPVQHPAPRPLGSLQPAPAKFRNGPRRKMLQGTAPWSKAEEQMLCAIVHEFPSQNWALVTDIINGSALLRGVYRRADQCKGHYKQIQDRSTDGGGVDEALNIPK